MLARMTQKQNCWIVAAFSVSLAACCVSGGKPAPAEAPPAAAAPTPPPAQVITSGNWSMPLPLGLQAAAAVIPADNPMSDDKIALGKLLYFDPRLSKDKTISCASCHNPYHGFADPHPTSAGVGGKLGGRNSPTIINRLFSTEQFWDGRAKDLEKQAHGPLTNPIEMQMGSHDAVVARVKAVKGYTPLFVKAFGDRTIDIGRVAKAIAAYERTVVAGNSPFDRYQAGDKDALSPAAVRGMKVFNSKGRCKVCHVGFNFTDESYRNLGVGMDQPKPDVGRSAVTKKAEDLGKFKTPTLRNLTETGPYLHDGSAATLAEVVELYDRGGVANSNLDTNMKPLNLTAAEKSDLVAFMESLTGPVPNAQPPASLPK